MRASALADRASAGKVHFKIANQILNVHSDVVLLAAVSCMVVTNPTAAPDFEHSGFKPPLPLICTATCSDNVASDLCRAS